MQYRVHESAIGAVLIAGNGGTVSEIRLPRDGRADRPEPDWERVAGGFETVAAQLDEYLAGDRTEFELDLDARGTEFQRSVWAALLEIPYGRTESYGEVARRIGRPAAVRAVGLANGRNPIPIVVPCHRVIGADGSLTGYGGGIDLKRRLLALEGVLLA